MDKKLILSLDVTQKDKAVEIISKVKNNIAMVKIGHYMISSFSSNEINEIVKDIPIMLDLKFFDIPNTIISAVNAYVRSIKNIKYFTFNGSMDFNTIKKVSEVKSATAVSVLILSSEDINNNSFIQKAKFNYSCGITNFICPPAYIKLLKNELGKDISIFSPGVRSINDKQDDHSKTFTAKESVELGSNYIIVGRPIITAKNISEKIKEYL